MIVIVHNYIIEASLGPQIAIWTIFMWRIFLEQKEFNYGVYDYILLIF
jgi:hypothetical protein